MMELLREWLTDPDASLWFSILNWVQFWSVIRVFWSSLSCSSRAREALQSSVSQCSSWWSRNSTNKYLLNQKTWFIQQRLEIFCWVRGCYWVTGSKRRGGNAISTLKNFRKCGQLQPKAVKLLYAVVLERKDVGEVWHKWNYCSLCGKDGWN